MHFGAEDDYEAHDALLCIASARRVEEEDRPRLTPDHRFKTAEEMRALFADLPEAADNTLAIARRCAFMPTESAPILPAFDPGVDEAEELRRLAREGLDGRLAGHVFPEGAGEEDAKPYRERLEYELGVIVEMKFPGYFLIVSEFIRWAKSKGIPVGPGRGSGAGSVVAWALQITDLDPLRWGLLFERFLNPERVSMPDFDIDFCQDRRDEVIAHVQDRYGHDRVAQIITFGKLQARAALRDVGRVLGMPFGQVDRISKLVPHNPANPPKLEDAVANEPALQTMRDEDETVRQLIHLALKLEGLYRHASTHAAGVVIADRPLQHIAPLYCDRGSSDIPAVQFSMKWAEASGLVKFDFLGLKTLTVLEDARKMLAEKGVEIDLLKLPLDDGKTFEMLSRGDTVGIFQMEGAGMRDTLKKLKPTRFEDLIAVVALYRPGPMENIPTYIKRKHGSEKIDYMYETLQPILEETYGIIIYQEQVMQIAQVLSGYTLGGADLLRRAMGKKIQSEMDAQRETFINGAVSRGVEPKLAEKIFNLVDKFAGYGFNKSPRRRLCVDRLPDGLAQGQPSGRVHGRVHDPRARQYGQARPPASRAGQDGCRAAAPGCAALRRPLPGRAGAGRRARHPLCACRGQVRRQGRHGGGGEGAWVRRPLQDHVRLRRAARPESPELAAAGKTGGGRSLRFAGAGPGRAFSPARKC